MYYSEGIELQIMKNNENLIDSEEYLLMISVTGCA